MNNDLVNEINNYRGDKLLKLSNSYITSEVRKALEAVAPGSAQALQGLSADDDGITKALWVQAVQSAEMSGALTFPHFGVDPIDADAVVRSYTEAVQVIAGRVARAILIVDGMSQDLSAGQDDWYLL